MKYLCFSSECHKLNWLMGDVRVCVCVCEGVCVCWGGAFLHWDSSVAFVFPYSALQIINRTHQWEMCVCVCEGECVKVCVGCVWCLWGTVLLWDSSVAFLFPYSALQIINRTHQWEICVCVCVSGVFVGDFLTLRQFSGFCLSLLSTVDVNGWVCGWIVFFECRSCCLVCVLCGDK